jgi:glyoxylase-like metal-dependent hydrolase (beta-lactamase superfamily II)
MSLQADLVRDRALPAGVSRIDLPLAGNPLRSINGYVLKGDDGYILVDCGWDTPDVLEALQAGLRNLRIGLEDVRTLVVTHRHPDHYGLAGTLLGLGQMRLLMHRLDWVFIQTHLTDMQQYDRDVTAWLARNGFDGPRSAINERRLESLGRVRIVAPHQELADGDSIAIAGSACSVVWTPGHTLGHICLHAPEQRFLIAGDHVLDPITPSVGLILEELGNPLGDFLSSLRKVAKLDADVVLPAHGAPFSGLERRVDELLAHHTEREAAILDALTGPGALTAGDVARALPWTRRRQRFADLGARHQAMAVQETLSHLEHLRAAGRLTRVNAGGRLRYSRAGSDILNAATTRLVRT